jgi:RNA polymerase sigma-70 factor (ECF subfamily)
MVFRRPGRPTVEPDPNPDAEPSVSAEQDLIARMLAGDERAFTAFFDAQFPRVYRFALPRLGRDPDAARDVVQATMTKAMRNLASFRGEAAVFTWLCQICRNEIADHVRARRRHADHVVPYEDRPDIRAALESIEAPDEDRPDRTHGRGETLGLIRAVLDRLPSRYGDALEWKYVDGRSVEEIGELLGIGHIAAQSLLQRARVAFREAIEAVYGEDAADVLAGLR